MSHIMYIDSLIIHRNRCSHFKMAHTKNEGHTSAALESLRQTHKKFYAFRH